MSAPIIVWFRRDLRLADHPALSAALASNRPIVPLFIWAPDEEKPWAPGAASNWWLHHSLIALDGELKKKGARLIIRRGPSLKALQQLMHETGATDVYWNRLYEPAVIARDQKIRAALKAQSFSAHLMHEPLTIMTQQEKPYQLFTPFYNACQELGDPGRPLAAPAKVPMIGTLSKKSSNDWNFSEPDWAAGFRDAWQPGEAGARKALANFAVEEYAVERDRPDRVGTSRLSPHLHFGEISPRQIWHAVRQSKRKNAEPYLRQLIWREFAHHLLFHFPHTATEPLRAGFKHFPWAKDAKALKAWQKGRTGFPIVDAGMRELWRTGWMHNRVRMIVASFLVKDLLIPWQEGAKWFWDTLVDADLANNTLGWQWSAGCGADAAPYFRVFNPHLQSDKFDPAGSYRKKWLHGRPDVPPIVDHGEARDRALTAYSELKAARGSS